MIGGVSWLLIVVGLGIVAVMVWRRGTRITRTQYRSAPWTLTGTLLVTVAAAALLAFFAPLPFFERQSLFYSAYPVLAAPRFDWPFILVLAMMALPAILGQSQAVSRQVPLVQEPIHDHD
jgi:hypothetical protein